MSFRRIATAVFALALAAGPVAAQITENPNKPAAAEPDNTPTPPESPPIQPSPVPEPGTILLVAGPAALGWVTYWRRKWRFNPAKPTDEPKT